MRRICTAAVLPLLLAGCTVGPKYQRPPLQPPGDFYAERQKVQVRKRIWLGGTCSRIPFFKVSFGKR